MRSIERETKNFVLKFTEIFLWRETVLRANEMKSDETPFSINFLGKIVHDVIDRYFALFLKGLKIFLHPWPSLIAPFKANI